MIAQKQTNIIKFSHFEMDIPGKIYLTVHTKLTLHLRIVPATISNPIVQIKVNGCHHHHDSKYGNSQVVLSIK